MVSGMVELKEIGKVEISNEATPEEIAAIKAILEKAGLIVFAKGKEILIRAERR